MQPGLPWSVRVAERLRRFVEFIGRWGAWLILPVVFFTVVDVVGRKIAWRDENGVLEFSLQIWLQNNLGRMFESTILQEMEWHFHAALFALVLGYGVVYNTHVRIDLIRENLDFRKKAWLELAGLTAFMIPYCLVVIWFAIEYVKASYAVGEVSSSTVGLTHRWLIKTVLVFGLITALVSGVAAWLQTATILWGPQDVRFRLMTLDWPEEGHKIEGKARIKLEEEYGLRLSDDAAAPAAAPPEDPPRAAPDPARP
jgi:TRAP-type mannitol/chloroaromatic compound transport system permease small subunit